MRLTSRRIVEKIRTRLDSNFFGLNLIADSLGRGVSTTSSSTVLPSHDLMWLEARDMFSATAFYYGDHLTGDMYGAGLYNNNGVSTTKIMAKSTATSNTYKLFPVNFDNLDGK